MTPEEVAPFVERYNQMLEHYNHLVAFRINITRYLSEVKHMRMDEINKIGETNASSH